MIHANFNRASYTRPNPNIHCGRKDNTQQWLNKAVKVLPIVHVYVPNKAKAVSSFRLCFDACQHLAGISDTLTATQIYNRLLAGKFVASFWNNQPAILRINKRSE